MVASSQIRQSDTALGWWSADGVAPVSGETALADALHDLKSPFFLVTQDDGTVAVAHGGVARMGVEEPSSDGYRIVGYAPGCEVANLGDRSFCADHGIRYPLLSGAMANGIGSTEIVSAMGQAGMLGFFGAAGLPLRVVEAAIERLQQLPDHVPYGFNLIHSPNEPNLEAGVVDLYLARGIHLVEASAYLDLTLPIVRFRVQGIHRDGSGAIVTPNRIVAKASRVEVASRFFSSPPQALLKQLVEAGEIQKWHFGHGAHARSRRVSR